VVNIFLSRSMPVGYDQSWEWETRIADASRFAAWSREVDLLRTFFTLPGLLIPALGPRILVQINHFQGSLILQIADTKSEPDPEPLPPLSICGPQGTGEPIFTATEVAFNGDASTDDDREAFSITLQDLEAPSSESCRTGNCPYDLLVVCALVRLAHHFPTICVSSDGGKAAVQRGVRICQQLFGDTTFPRWCFDDVEGADQVFSP
jgi:hypothetical protein